jgi:hypothetical protein
MRELDRMVVWKEVTERTQVDPFGPRQRLGDQQVRRRARLPRRGEVLADPRFLEAEPVEPLDLGEIPALAVPDRPLGRMRRHEQGAEFQPAVHACHRQSFPVP